MRERLAKVHIRNAEGALAPMDFEIPQNPEFEMGGGGLYGTAGDYIKFIRMILNGGSANGNQVLKPETVALMSRNAMGNVKVELLKTHMPALTNDAEFFPGMDKSWGLSFMINNQQAPTGRTAADGRELLSALEVCCSFEAIEYLRVVAAHSAEEAEAILTRSLLALLAR